MGDVQLSPQEKVKRLTLKQKLWIRSYFDMDGQDNTFGNYTRSALKAYYPDFDLKKEYKDYSEEELKNWASAKSIGWENFTKLDVEIEDLMNEAGLSDSFWLNILQQNTKATKLYGKNAIEHPDYQSRNKAVELGLRVKKKLVDRIDHTNKGEKFDGVTNEDIAKTVRDIITGDDIQPTNAEGDKTPDPKQVQEQKG